MAHPPKTFIALGAAALMATAAGLATATSTSAAPAARGGPVSVKVTIKAEGTDLSGRFSTGRAAPCGEDRKVIVMKQKGKRGGGDDKKFASDVTEVQGDHSVWSTGNTGTAGRFYAKVKPLDECLGDTSRTIKVTKDE